MRHDHSARRRPMNCRNPILLQPQTVHKIYVVLIISFQTYMKILLPLALLCLIAWGATPAPDQSWCMLKGSERVSDSNINNHCARATGNTQHDIDPEYIETQH